MMRTRFPGLLSAALIIVLSQTATASGVIFDNTTSPLVVNSFTAEPIGNEVTVSGPAIVGDLEIGVNQQGVAGTADLQAFLYLNDGTGGAPGTLLWSSSIMTNVALTGGNDLIAFAVPSIAVPSTFTWAIQISNTTPVAAGLPAFDPPTVGTIDHSWFGGPGNWTSLDSLGANGHYMARILTVPEPSSILYGSLAVAIGLGRAWSLRKRAATAAH
jgi:hypothetical protein